MKALVRNRPSWLGALNNILVRSNKIISLHEIIV